MVRNLAGGQTSVKRVKPRKMLGVRWDVSFWRFELVKEMDMHYRMPGLPGATTGVLTIRPEA